MIKLVVAKVTLSLALDVTMFYRKVSIIKKKTLMTPSQDLSYVTRAFT
jgi:hypothetical protein